MKYITSVVSLALVNQVYTKTTQHGFEKCYDHLIASENLISFDEISMFPEIPEDNEVIDLHFKGSSNKRIDDLNIELTFSVYDVDVLKEKFNICELKNVDCPIHQNQEFQGDLTYEVPIRVPKGIEVEAKIVFMDGEVPIGCVSKEFKVKHVHHEGDLVTSRFGFADDEVDFLYKAWQIQYGDEIHMPKSDAGFGQNLMLTDRKHIFKQNLMKIASHNAQQLSWKMGLNQFAHLTSDEFKTIFASGYKAPKKSNQDTGLRVSKQNKNTNMMFRLARGLGSWFGDEEARHPAEVNWVTKGAVTPVKNQGACGSCWSFATTGALEGAYFIKYGELVSFSEQELVACDHVDLGCNGGSMDNAYTWIEESKGLCSETDYPYTSAEGVRGFCQQTGCTAVKNSAPISFVDVEHHDISLEEAVAKQPVAVAIEADEEAFQFYNSGVLTAQCSQKLDHGVLVVGYGEEDGQKYWLIKNSWGPQWGAEGYIKIVRGTEEYEGGECGVLLSPSFPVY